jgi:hypothetical protein
MIPQLDATGGQYTACRDFRPKTGRSTSKNLSFFDFANRPAEGLHLAERLLTQGAPEDIVETAGQPVCT